MMPKRNPSSEHAGGSQPTHTYCRFPRAGSRFRHWFGRFCFNRFSCASTHRLCSLGLEGQLVGDLKCLPQCEDDLVCQVLWREHRDTKLLGAYELPHIARSGDRPQQISSPSHQQVASCPSPGKAAELLPYGEASTELPPHLHSSGRWDQLQPLKHCCLAAFCFAKIS